MALTDVKVRNLKYDPHGAKKQKYYDGQGLFADVQKTCITWRYDYVCPITGKKKTITIGKYPAVTLLEARKKRDEYRRLIVAGDDPIAEKEKTKHVKAVELNSTFKYYADELIANKEKAKHGNTSQVQSLLDNYILPYIGNMPVKNISTKLLKDEIINRIEQKGYFSVSANVRTVIKQALDLAIDDNIIEINPAQRLKTTPYKTRNHPAVTNIRDLPQVLNVIWQYAENPKVRNIAVPYILMMCVYTWQRPSEIRELTWDKIDFDNQCIAHNAYKTGQSHIIPLSHQAMEIIQRLHQINGDKHYIFASHKKMIGCICRRHVAGSLRNLGLQNIQTAHGFRATARTIIREKLKYPFSEILEMQLGHAKKNSNGTAYDRTSFLDERREIMQRWADFVDAVRNGEDVERFIYRYEVPPVNKLRFVV